MSNLELSSYGLDRPESGDDVVVPFTLETLGSRGRVVHLGDALDAILTRHNYPAPVARLLGEAVVLAALIGSSLKFDGRFILQTQTDGPVNLIVVDLDAPDGLRGYARFDADAVMRAIEMGKASSILSRRSRRRTLHLDSTICSAAILRSGCRPLPESRPEAGGRSGRH